MFPTFFFLKGMSHTVCLFSIASNEDKHKPESMSETRKFFDRFFKSFFYEALAGAEG